MEDSRKQEICYSDQQYQCTSSDVVARVQAEKIRIRWSAVALPQHPGREIVTMYGLWGYVIRTYSDGFEREQLSSLPEGELR